MSANREPFIENGEVDIVVATYTINDKRKEVVSFAGPYYMAGQDILVLAGNRGHQGPGRPRRQAGLLGDRLDARGEHRRDTAPSRCSTDGLHRLPRAAAQRHRSSR